MAPIDDERLESVAGVVGARKVTPAAIRVVDVPGTGAAQLGNLRQVDAILAVVDGFSSGADPARPREPRARAARRRPRPRRAAARAGRKQAKSGDPQFRTEAAELEELLAHLDAGGSLRDRGGPLPSARPADDQAAAHGRERPERHRPEAEAELAELPDDEAAAFREGESALKEIVRRLFESLDLISFITAGDTETRAWTLRRGQTALEAAAAVHSDIARGFIRAEVILWSDLVECGSHGARRRALERLEGKGYVVQDGDVINVRFNV